MQPVSLQAVVDEMDICGDEMISYINKQTGELLTISEEESMLVENGYGDEDSIPDWQMEILPKVKEVLESGDFIPLPDQFEIHEYSIMERFCLSVEDEKQQDELLRAIRGKGAFRYFKDTIYRLDIQNDWYNYRNDTLKKIAADFLKMEEIAFVDDAKPKAGT